MRLATPRSRTDRDPALVQHDTDPGVQGVVGAREARHGKIGSAVYNVLSNLAWMGRLRYLGRVWRGAWTLSCRHFSGPVRTTIHGRRAVVNFGHTYRITARQCPNFNSPLLELAFQVYSTALRPITVVDVGANVGDTILLLESNCPGIIGDFYCIDADPEFFGYLQNNLREFRNGTLLFALLSSSDGTERTLLRTQAASASAQGRGGSLCCCLDTLLGRQGLQRVDLLKTDVDGLDGKVLLGAKEILTRYRPAVIFEWHPILCKNTSNNWTDHFSALEQCGYTRYIWFTKYGDFSHYAGPEALRGIEMLAEFCLSGRSCMDWHYDVIALHADSPLSHVSLADLSYARERRSKW